LGSYRRTELAIAYVPNRFEDDHVPDVMVNPAEVVCGGRAPTAWEATALTITMDGREAFYFDHHKHWSLPWRSGSHSGDGRLYHSRCAGSPVGR